MTAWEKIVVHSHPAEEWAYLAGLLDGEGYFARHMSSQTVGLVVNMTDEPTIRWLSETFGGRVNAKPSPRSEWRDQWTWRLNRKEALAHVLRGVEPYLRLKRPQARLMLDFLDVAIKDRNPASPERQRRFEAMAGMNTRGAA